MRNAITPDALRAIAAKITAIKTGLDIGLQPKHMIENELKDEELIIKSCEVPRHPEFIYPAWHKDLKDNAIQ